MKYVLFYESAGVIRNWYIREWMEAMDTP